MNECPNGITIAAYLEQAQASAAPPGILLEAQKAVSAEELANQLFLPLHRIGRLKACGGSLWITTSCASWEEAASLPQKLVRLSIVQRGLHSHFQGGAVIDLRWCTGSPTKGQLNKLERFLFDLRSDLHPLILTAPGTSQEVWEELSTLQLQTVTIGQEGQKSRKRQIGFEREC